jgi:hypothetical protein
VRVGAARCLFPRPTKNPDGHAPVGSGTYRLALYRWLERCDVRDAHGQPVHLTPHQWRSGGGEDLPLPAPTDPGVTISRHRALLTRRQVTWLLGPTAIGRTGGAASRQVQPTTS